MTTTALYKALIEANVSPETAERAVEGLAAADEVATKADLAQLEARLAERIAGQEIRLVEKMADQEARLAERMADQKVELIKWMVGLFIAFFIANSITNIGAVYTMLQALK